MRKSTQQQFTASSARRKTSIGIGKRGLALRRNARTPAAAGKLAVRKLGSNAVNAATAAVADSTPAAANYAARVINKEFEPTALRARELAAARGQSLHQLAHELGYAGPPPAVRQPVNLATLTRTQLSKLTSYHISDLSRLFARRHPPSLTKLAKVAAAYGASLDDTLAALGW